MVDLAAIASAASALKTAYELSKAALGARDAKMMRAKINEMQEEISSALASAISAQTDQYSMLQRVRDLEEEITDLKAWGIEKERYELKKFFPGVLVYSLKKDDAKGEPPHHVCPACYQNRKKSILQATSEMRFRLRVFACPLCKTEFTFGLEEAMPPLQRQAISDYNPYADR